MRPVIFSVLLLVACGETSASLTARTAADENAPPRGAFHAASETARAVTGDLTVERAGLVFANGVTLYTRALLPRRGYDLIARGGMSYAAAAVGSSDLVVELRRVVQQSVAADAPAIHGACESAEPPEYVAIVYAPPARTLTLIVLTGADPPGPHAEDSRVCAIYGFTAPEGARTREGVVL